MRDGPCEGAGRGRAAPCAVPVRGPCGLARAPCALGGLGVGPCVRLGLRRVEVDAVELVGALAINRLRIYRHVKTENRERRLEYGVERRVQRSTDNGQRTTRTCVGGVAVGCCEHRRTRARGRGVDARAPDEERRQNAQNVAR